MTQADTIRESIRALVHLRATVKLTPHVAYSVDHVVRQLLFQLDKLNADTLR